jgi:RNA polymerase sigma-70 factor, ECF subfamily
VALDSPRAATRNDERTLVEHLRSGDESAFAELVDRHHASLVRIATGYVRDLAVAEEVAQETWLALINGIERFEERSSLKTWLFRILANRAKSRAVRERRSVPVSALADNRAAAEDAGVDEERFLPAEHPEWPHHWANPPRRWEAPEERLLSEEARLLVLAEIEKLPPNQRAVIALRDVEGLSAEEACNVLDISDTNQRVLLHRARSRVRRALEHYFDGERK